MPMLDTLVITPLMVRQIASIDEFRGSWQALQSMPQEYLSRLLHVATVESIGSSTRIEGSRLSNEQVDTFLAHLAATTFTSRDEQEVAGYADVMRLIFSSWTAMPLTEATIRQLHRLLLAHSPREDWHRGAYKTTSNAVAAFDANAQPVGVVFETADPFETPRLMTDLVDWTNETLDAGIHHPLLVIGAFVVVFLNIHPFQDGNGRLSRLLTTLLLLREGYAYVPYSSLESVVERNKGECYRALRQTQLTLRSDNPNWGIPGWNSFSQRCNDRPRTCASRQSMPLPKLRPRRSSIPSICSSSSTFAKRNELPWRTCSKPPRPIAAR